MLINPKRSTIVLVSIIMILVMFAIVPWLTKTLPSPFGYFSIFLIYWLGFCLPFGLWFQSRNAIISNLSFDVGANKWVPWAVGIQVALVGISNWLLLPYGPLVTAFLLAVAFGTVNGLLEELFWRGAYLEQGGRHSAKLMTVSAILFGIWHLALGSAYGVTYEGGVLTLVGGGFALGVFWTFVAFRTGKTGWTTVAHILTNVAAFTGLIASNFVG